MQTTPVDDKGPPCDQRDEECFRKNSKSKGLTHSRAQQGEGLGSGTKSMRNVQRVQDEFEGVSISEISFSKKYLCLYIITSY